MNHENKRITAQRAHGTQQRPGGYFIMKKAYIIAAVLFVSALLLVSALAHARPRATVKQQSIRAENTRAGGQETLVLPYAFSSDSMGMTFGVGGGVKGFYQEQLLLAGTVFGAVDESTRGIVLGAWDYRPSWSKRLFFTVAGSAGQYPNQRAYGSLVIKPGTVRPGSNDSDKDDFITAGGDNNWLDLKVEYVLPIGSARHEAMATYKLKNGMLVEGGTGGDNWNPFTGGITTVVLRQFNQLESFDTAFGEFERTIHPVEVGLGYNNTDYPPNPSTGSNQYIGIKHDFGWGAATTEWTFLELEATKYFNFGESGRARQRVAAFNVWTGDALSWNEEINAEGLVEIDGNPPQYEGATLGGFYRMRAYPSRRFHDRSVLYTTAEYRYTPRWNPIGDLSWLRWLKMDWWQFVGFVEGGRVANSYGDLFSDWKIDAGLGIRAFMAGGVVRFDVAAADGESAMWVMFGHPF